MKLAGFERMTFPLGCLSAALINHSANVQHRRSERLFGNGVFEETATLLREAGNGSIGRTRVLRTASIVSGCKNSAYSIAAVAADLGMAANQLQPSAANPRIARLAAFPGNGNMNSRHEEVYRLRRELPHETEERDVLQKATVFFAKTSR